VTATLTADRFAEAAAILELSDDYKVLRRFVPDPAVYLNAPSLAATETFSALFVDVEATGLDVRTDKIIELSMVPLVFDRNGIVYDVGKSISFFEDPKIPLGDRVVELTGITDDMLKGQRIDDAGVTSAVQSVDFVIAHHADYDRKMLERRLAVFTAKPWGCTYHDVPWEKTFGTRSGRLQMILADVMGQFCSDAHRAADDCHVAVHLMANAVDGIGRTAMSYLLESTRKITYRVWAVDSEFMAKEKLSARGYEWSPADRGGRKCWYRDVRAADVAEEMMFARDIGGATPEVQKLTAIDRYSVRAS
jgi:DNA polymerase III subunit epsilon